MTFVEPLNAHHDRAAFDCGKDPLNRFLREQARQNADRHLGVTRVVVAEPGSAQIQAYYTLVTRTVASHKLAPSSTRSRRSRSTRAMVSGPIYGTIRGGYSPAATSHEVPAKKKLPEGPIGVVLLGRLAVDRRFQGQRLGQRMLLRSMSEVEQAARLVGIHALVLDTIDEEARSWYLGLDFGFQALPEDPGRLFVSIAFIQQLALGRPGSEL